MTDSLPLDLAHAAQRRLALAVARNGRVGALEVDPVDGRLLWSPGTAELLGVADVASLGTLLGQLPPPVRARVLRAWVASVRGRRPFDVEVRLLRKADPEAACFRLRSDGLEGEMGARRVQLIVEERSTAGRIAGAEGLGERRLAQAMDMARIGAWTVDLATETLTWSDEVFRIHDLEPGVTPTVEQAIRFYTPESQARVSNALAGLLSGAGPYDIEHELITAEGRHIWVRSIGDVERADDGVPRRLYGVVQDVTARRDADAAVRTSEERLLMALEGADDGVWDWYPGEGRVWFSKRCLGLLDLPLVDEFMSVEAWTSHVHPDDVPQVAAAAARATAPGPGTFREEFRMRHADGTWRWILSRGKVVVRGEDGLAERMVGTHSDVTDQVLLRAELETAREAAEAAARAKAEFLATMSHEIRTPMNGMLGMAQILLDTELDPDQRQVASTILHSGTSLLRILDDVLDLSRFEAGELQLESVPFDPVACARDVVDLAKFDQKGTAGVRLRFQVGDGVPDEVLGDPHRLRQVLLNLVCNGVKFTEEGQVEVRVSASAEPGGVRLRYVVEDTGIGFDPTIAERLFEAFEQADGSTTRRFGGSGLGLAVCKRLVGLMGGEIGCASAPGVGSTFWVELPVRRPARVSALRADAETAGAHPGGAPADVAGAPAGARGREATEPARALGATGSTPAQFPAPPAPLPRARPTSAPGTLSVLVVEDTPVNQLVARRMLEGLGCEVVVASDGAEALERMDGRSFDLVLMDCQMPVMDGYEAATRLRELPCGREVVVVAMTANAMAGDRDRCLAAGMDDYLVKPVMRATLSRLVERVRSGELRACPSDGSERSARIEGAP